MTVHSPIADGMALTDGVTTGRLLARAIAAEWARLWTVRATWWYLAAAALIVVGMATVAGLSAAGDPSEARGDSAWRASEFTTMPGQFALLALALTGVTADYASRGIVPSLQWTPRRGILFVARALVLVVTATGLGVLLGGAAAFAGWMAARPVLTLPLDQGLDVLGTVALVIGSGAALSVGLGFLLRSTAGALVAVFLLMLVLPVLLPQFGYEWLTTLGQSLPGSGAAWFLLEPLDGMSEASAVAVLVVWAAGALLLGWLRLVHDDVES